MADCGTGQARLQLADPTRWWLADPAAPHLHIDKLGGMAGEQSRLRNPGLQLGEIKPWGLRRQQEKLPASQERSLERPTGAQSMHKPTHLGISAREAQFYSG